MNIKYSIENEYMKCVLQINEFSDLYPWVRSNHRVELGPGGGGGGGGGGGKDADEQTKGDFAFNSCSKPE